MITYRKAVAADVPTVHAMLQALSDHDGGDYAVGSVESLLQHGFGARPLFQAVIAEKNDVPIGMAIFYPDFSTHRGQSGVYVQDIYVDDTARGAGVGRGLLKFMLQAQDWNADYITLGVSPDNPHANGFYNRLGFSARGYQMMIMAGTQLQALRSHP